MSAMRVAIYGMLALLLALAPETSLAAKTVALLPVADYSAADSLAAARQQSVSVATALRGRLVGKGLRVVDGEAVFNTLKGNKCIQQLTYGQDFRPDATTTTLARELNGDWSDWMKEELRAMIKLEQKRLTPGLAAQDDNIVQPDTTPLTAGQVIAMGRQFQADYILRGRLLAYELEGEHAQPPPRRGILPIFATVGGNEAYAVAAAKDYDTLDPLMLAGFFMTNDQDRNVVRLQLWAQDGETGAIVWSNIQNVDWGGFGFGRAGSRNAAITQAAASLIDDFWTTVAVDSDHDSVFDHRDRCPGTAAGIAVDSFGCPKDSDGDGVPDYLDTCPDTKAGVKVDQNGCPKDTDKDGVTDNLDACPDTPPGVAVTANGCPQDQDQDGVPDYLDKCANTPAGRAVDKNGCPLPLQEKVSMELQVLFDSNRAAIKPAYQAHLQKVSDFLKAYPKATAEIEGHTDHEGTPAYNLKLSQQRAEAVRQYLIDHFAIAPERLTAKGYGESRPVADNRSAAGRAENRRAVAIFSATAVKE